MMHDKVYELVRQQFRNAESRNDDYKDFYKRFLDKKPVGIYFDETLMQNTELSVTAFEFLKAGFLPMPFSSIMMSIDGFYVDDEKPEDTSPLYVWFFKENGDLFFYIVVVDEGKLIGLSPFAYTIREGYERAGFLSHVKKGYDKEKIDNALEEQKELIHDASTACIIGLMLLNHPAYKQENIEISERLQKSRQKRKKDRLSKYIKVGMRKEYRDAIESGGGDIRKPHWRRGHIRTLQDGRKIPVQACLVNFDGDPLSIDAPQPKTYIIKS